MLKDLFKFWNANNFNKVLIIVTILVLLSVVYFLSQESFMMWYFPEATSGEYKSMKVKKIPAGFQDPNSIYIDKFALPPPAHAQNEWPPYNPANPFAKLNLEKENYVSGPFSLNPRFGISPNYCSMGVNGKSCYAEDCKDCQAAFEQDTPLNGSVKAKPSQQMYT